MKRVTYQDLEGRWHVSMLPDSAPDSHAPKGVRVGPPCLESLGLPREMEVRLHNQLYHRGLLTERDIARAPNEVNAAIMAAVKLDAQRIAALYVGSD